MRTNLLGRMLEPLIECLTVDAARNLVSLRADTATQARVTDLANKANSGILDEDERAEYDRYLALFHIVTIMQAKSRARLRN